MRPFLRIYSIRHDKLKRIIYFSYFDCQIFANTNNIEVKSFYKFTYFSNTSAYYHIVLL